MTDRPLSQKLCPVLVCLALATGVSRAQSEEVLDTDVYVSGQEGYHSFRIPSVIVTPAGTVLAFCEGRKTSRSDDGDIDLVLKRSQDQGVSWGPLTIVHEEGGDASITIGNPCPVIDSATGTIWLPFCHNNDKVFVTKSTDDGQTWETPREITSDVKPSHWGWYATGPGVGIQLKRGAHAGRLVIPCDHREKVDGQDFMFSHVFYSDDGGESWQLGGSADRHTDECQVVELHDGRLLLNMRNYWGRTGKQPDKGGKRAIALSKDSGKTWSPLRFDETLIEPICQGSLIAVPDKKSSAPLLVFSNPASTKSRHQLTVRLSEDEGESWAYSRVLFPGLSAYSCLCPLPEDQLGCLYECGKDSGYDVVRFSRFSLDWIRDSR